MDTTVTQIISLEKKITVKNHSKTKKVKIIVTIFMNKWTKNIIGNTEMKNSNNNNNPFPMGNILRKIKVKLILKCANKLNNSNLEINNNE